MKLLKLYFTFKFIGGNIYLTKGLFIRRNYIIPLSSVYKLTVRRTLLMRLLRAKEVTLFTYDGKRRFYLPRREALPFAESRSVPIKPRLADILFGAFIDTRALGGIFVFSAALRRVSKIFGETPVRRLRELLSVTADKMGEALILFRFTIPRILLTAAAFALAAWVFVFISRALSLARFSVRSADGRVYIRRGLITVYEHLLLADTAAVSCDTFTTLLVRRAPLYLHGEMLLPCVKRGKLPKALKALCGFEIPEKFTKAPPDSLLGRIAAPLSLTAIFAAGALFAPPVLTSVKALSVFGALYCLFISALFFVYTKREGIALGERSVLVSERRGLRLYTTIFAR